MIEVIWTVCVCVMPEGSACSV